MRLAREAIYAGIVRAGEAPGTREIAAATGVSIEAAAGAVRALAEAHVIVLEPGTERIRFAPPFAAVETGFRVESDARRRFAPCAWDAFGIPAALHRDAEIAARCAQSGEPMNCSVRDGQAYGNGVVHLLVPAARFWDDIIYT